MTKAIINPKIEPVNTISTMENKKVSRYTISCTIPTASIKPGTAYPKDNSELNFSTNLLGLSLTEKLINRANPAQIIPVPKDRLSVFIELLINLSLKKPRFTSYAQRLSSTTGTIKPIKIGIKQIKNAINPLKPCRLSSRLGEKFELLDV